MKCPVCGAAELVRDTRDVSYSYKGETTTITDVMADFCSSCGEAVLDREQGDHYSEAVGLFQQRVNALTAETLAKSERGEDVYKAKDYRDLFDQLGI